MSEHEWIGVRKVMRTDVAFVDGKTTILDAMRTMKKVGATCLIVNKRHEKDEYGMLTFKDIAKKVIAANRAPERVNVFEIMTKPVIAVHADMDIRYCARLFSRFRISHAPVVENDEVIGFVSYYMLVLEGLADLD